VSQNLEMPVVSVVDLLEQLFLRIPQEGKR